MGPATALALAAPLLAAIVVQDRTPMMAAAEAQAPQQAVLWQGDWLEVRGERRDYYKVYDYRRERPGYVHRDRVRVTSLEEGAAPALRAVIDFLRDTPGQESLGIGYVALYLRAAPAAQAGVVFDALGSMAERLAGRASASSRGRQAETLAAHLEVAGSYGVRFLSFSAEDRTRICYDGDAFRQVLASPSSLADARAQAALALSAPRCIPPELPPHEARANYAKLAALLQSVDPASVTPFLANRLRLRQAVIASWLSYAAARRGQEQEAAEQSRLAYQAFLRVDGNELAPADRWRYERAALQVAATRWAREPAVSTKQRRLRLELERQPSGETCLSLWPGAGSVKASTSDKLPTSSGDQKPAAKASASKTRAQHKALVTRCTYGHVWSSSVQVSPQGRQLAVAVQHLPGWVELWLFRQGQEGGWHVDALLPATTTPELGYVELAGWTPGGKELLVVREALVQGAVRTRFQALTATSLAPRLDARSLTQFVTFRRWHSADWKRGTLALRAL